MPTYRSPEMLSGAISDLRRRITAGSGDRAAAVHLLELVAIVAEMLASKDDRARLVDTITERDGQIATLRHECDGRLLQLAAVGHVLDVTPPLFPEVRDSQRWTDFATKLPPAAQELKGRCERLAAERDELRAEVASLKDRPTLTAERLAEAMRDQGFLFNDHLAAAKRLLVRLGPVTLPAAPSGEVSDEEIAEAIYDAAQTERRTQPGWHGSWVDWSAAPDLQRAQARSAARAVRELRAKAPTGEAKDDVTARAAAMREGFEIARDIAGCGPLHEWPDGPRYWSEAKRHLEAKIASLGKGDGKAQPAGRCCICGQIAATWVRGGPQDHIKFASCGGDVCHARIHRAIDALSGYDKTAGLTSLHICRTCDASGWALAGVNVPPGWSRIERIDGPDSICPKCAIDPSALDCLRDDGYEQAHVRPWTQPAVRDEGPRSPDRAQGGCPVCGSTARIADGDSWCIECERAFTAEIDGTGRCSHQGVALWAVARSHARSPAREDVALTVGAALADPRVQDGSHVVEYQVMGWHQSRPGKDRDWRGDEWGDWYGAGSGPLPHEVNKPARLVALADADAPPESRGPIGGAS